MKKLIVICCAVVSFASSISLNAQTTYSPRGFNYGIGLELALPSRGFDVAYHGGVGASARISKGLTENWDVTLTGGAIAFFTKSFGNSVANKNSIFIPIKAGGRFWLSENVYAMGELGLTVLRSYTPNNLGSSNSTYQYVNKQYFTYGPSIGANFNGFDIGLRYENLHGSGFVGLRAGYEF